MIDFRSMKNLFLFLAFCIGLSAFSQEKPIVVVELFTSEGCSSCPPADRLLSSIVNAEHADAEVIALSFHVDYWDYIGWKDPYADSRFSKRQRNYARKLVSSVYTPQMVVNGRTQFVGSNRSSWKKALSDEKSSARVKPLEITSKSLEDNKLRVTVASQSSGDFINVAVVERNLSQSVNRGENRGRLLTHDNVVRAFDSKLSGEESNKFEIVLPDNLDLTKSSLVVYNQNPSDLEITEAKKIPLSSLQ